MNIRDYIKVTDSLKVSEKCRDEVFNMNRESKISHKKIKKSTSIFIVAAVLACGGTITAFASGFGVFESFMNNKNREYVSEDGIKFKVDKYDRDNYSQIAEHSDALEEEWYTNDELAVSVDSVYCDGRNIIFALKGYMIDGNSDNTDYISLVPKIKIGDKTFDPFDNELNGCVRRDGSLIRNEDEANSFSGVVKFEFNNDNIITEQTDVEITLQDLSGRKDYYAGEMTFKSENPITFTVSAQPDESSRVQTDYAFSNNGFEAKIYEIGPAGIIIGTKNPEEYENNQEEIEITDSDGTIMRGPKYSIIVQCFDKNGDILPYLPQYELIDYNDGFSTSILPATDSKTITVKWFNKQEHDDSTENGMKLYYEYTIDISENN